MNRFSHQTKTLAYSQPLPSNPNQQSIYPTCGSLRRSATVVYFAWAVVGLFAVIACPALAQQPNLVPEPKTAPPKLNVDESNPADKTTHRFLACGKQTYIMEPDGKRSWTYPASTRDGYVLDDGQILLTLSKSKKRPGGAAVLVDPKSGKEEVLWKGTQAEVNSVHPTQDGTFVLTEAGPKPRLVEIDREGEILVEFELKCQKKNIHLQTRMARKLADGTYLVPHLLDFAVFNYDANGNVLSKIDTTVKGDPDRKIHSWPFTAIRHGAGHTFVCMTNSNRVADFDAEGKLVWELTNDDLPGKWLQDPCGGQVLPNGNFVIACYAAGRKDPTTPKLFEVNQNREVVWKYADGQKVGIHHFQVISTDGKKITPTQK